MDPDGSASTTAGAPSTTVHQSQLQGKHVEAEWSTHRKKEGNANMSETIGQEPPVVPIII